MPGVGRRIYQTFFRLKTVDYDNVGETKLDRCLNTLDLTALGIGSTLGAGIYVVAGQVAKEHSGPSVVISFLIAAIASVFAGLCYAEFGARVPKTGSAYVYTYVTVGELLAFIIGWNLILEYVIGTASVASAWSSYFDSLINEKIGNFFNETMPMNISFLGPYPDFFAFGITLLLTSPTRRGTIFGVVCLAGWCAPFTDRQLQMLPPIGPVIILAVGVKESTLFNNLFTSLNILIVIYSVICGSFKADVKNWSLPPHTEIDPKTHEAHTDQGGFMPFGFSQMLAGASTCFYAFVGFDAIATTGEEVKNPQKAIPISIIVSLLSCCAAYCGISIVITLMIPYYTMDHDAPLPLAFRDVGYTVAQWIISIGAIAGLSTSLLGAMFPLPRILYAMASDGLIFRFLANINERFKTPLIATVISGLFAGIMAAMFALKELVDMMSIGTLMAYTLVACSVLLLRYKVDEEDKSGVEDDSGEIHQSYTYEGKSDWRGKPCRRPSLRTQTIVAYSILSIAFFSLLMGIAVMLMGLDTVPNANYLWILFGVGAVGVLVSVAIIYQQPQSQAACTFKVPILPIVATLSCSINIILMLKLSSATWIRFAVWMAIGFIIYFGYGVWQSSEGQLSLKQTERSSLINPTDCREADPVDLEEQYEKK